MVKKLLNILLIPILLGFTIYFWYRYKTLKDNQGSQVLTEYKTDTIFIEKPFKPEPIYQTHVIPKEILVHEKESSHNLIDSATHYTFSDQDSLFQFLLERNKLQLNLFNPSTGTYSSRIFPINLEEYQYNWFEGNLTAKKKRNPKLSINPYLYTQYRFFHNLLDMGAGISFKTKKLDYNLGINIYHYPQYQRGFGTDLEVSIRYNF